MTAVASTPVSGPVRCGYWCERYVQFPDPEPDGLPHLEAGLTSEVELTCESGVISESELDQLSLFDGLLQQLAAAAELCLKPLRFGARYC